MTRLNQFSSLHPNQEGGGCRLENFSSVFYEDQNVVQLLYISGKTQLTVSFRHVGKSAILIWSKL